MASDEKWYFTKAQLEKTPSRQCSIDGQKELFYRQQAANFIQDMGQRLKVSQLCINTASVYMHRFYVFHSFTHFPWNSIAAAALFLSAKVEEQPRKLEHVIRVHNICKNPREPPFDINSEKYQAQCQDLVFNENILLQTLGFDVAIDHPHAHVVRCCHLVRASKDLAQSSYFMASTSLHLTTFCLQYKPTVVACFCIHLACKWSNWEIPLSKEKKEWFSYVDPTVTTELLQQLTEEFLAIFSKCPSRLKEKILANSDVANKGNSSAATDPEFKKLQSDCVKESHKMHGDNKFDDTQKIRHRPPEAGASNLHQQQREREYREKKERGRLAHPHKVPPAASSMQQQQSSSGASTKFPISGHSRPLPPPPVDPKLQQKQHSSTSSASRSTFVKQSPVPVVKSEPKDGFRELHRDATDGKSEPLYKDPYLYNSAKDSKMMNENSALHIEHHANSERKLDPHRIRSGGESSMKMPAPKMDMKPIKQEPIDRKPFANAHHQSWISGDKTQQHQQQQLLQQQKYGFNKTGGLEKGVAGVKSIKSEPMMADGCNNGSHGPLFDDRKPFAKKPSMFSPEKSPPRKAPSMETKHPLLERPHSMLKSFGHDLPLSMDKKVPSGSTKSEQFRIGNFRHVKEESTTNSNFGYLQQFGVSNNGSSSSGLPTDGGGNSSSTNIGGTTLLSSCNPLGQPIVNGIETNPTLISNLLKEAPSVPHLTSIASTLSANVHHQQQQQQQQPPQQQESSSAAVSLEETKEKHKDRKKKSKEKHKHKDRTKDEKEKKRKHKDKDKEKQKGKSRKERGSEEFATAIPEQPIKITISKDKIQDGSSVSGGGQHSMPNVGLKIKIPKDKIKTDIIPESMPAPGIKIKISKDVISNMSGDSGGGGGGNAKKREYDRSAADLPVAKVAKSGNSRYLMSDKSNGRSSLATSKIGPSTSDNFKNSQ